MKHKRMAAAALLALTLPLLTGCDGMVSERPMVDVSALTLSPGVNAPLEDGFAPETERMTLYYLSEGGGRLTPVSREVTREGGASRAQAALDALLAGPKEGERAHWPVAGGRAARMLEVSGGVATVSLPARYRALEPPTLYAVRLAVANTLCELPEISYVNVLVDGREEGLDLGATMPVGTLSRVEDLDARARYEKLNDQRAGSAGFTRLTTLYFPAADGKLLLPVVRSVAYGAASPIDCLYTLLGELGKGTSAELAMENVPAPMDYIEEMPEIVRTEDGGARAIEIRFGPALTAALDDAGLTLGLYAAMLTDTLMGFVPGVEGVQIVLGSEPLAALAPEQTPDGNPVAFEQALLTREHFDGYVGAPAVLYTAGKRSGTLEKGGCVLPQARQSEPRALLLALMRAGVLPAGLAEKDVLAVRVEEDTVALNLSGVFGDALFALPPQQARAAVYAMVNTLTQGRSQQSVAFFFEGSQRGALPGGLHMGGRLLRNPGMVVE